MSGVRWEARGWIPVEIDDETVAKVLDGFAAMKRPKVCASTGEVYDDPQTKRSPMGDCWYDPPKTPKQVREYLGTTDGTEILRHFGITPPT